MCSISYFRIKRRSANHSSVSLLIGHFYLCLFKSVITRTFKVGTLVCLHIENKAFVLRCFNGSGNNYLYQCGDFNYAEQLLASYSYQLLNHQPVVSILRNAELTPFRTTVPSPYMKSPLVYVSFPQRCTIEKIFRKGCSQAVRQHCLAHYTSKCFFQTHECTGQQNTLT